MFIEADGYRISSAIEVSAELAYYSIVAVGKVNVGGKFKIGIFSAVINLESLVGRYRLVFRLLHCFCKSSPFLGILNCERIVDGAVGVV